MKVWITLDLMDGGTTTRGPVYHDEIDLTGLLFYLNRADVAGVTFTRANPLQKVMKPDWRCKSCDAINKFDDKSCLYCQRSVTP